MEKDSIDYTDEFINVADEVLGRLERTARQFEVEGKTRYIRREMHFLLERVLKEKRKRGLRVD